MIRAPIPLTVIGGFLGSGKTTLINHVVASCSGLRACILVNDFGRINIDARLIESAGGEAIGLTNGCVCCSIGGDLTSALIRVLRADPSPDCILIEASGVSDPGRIAEVGLADPGLVLEGVVVVADAEAVRRHWDDPLLADTVQRQLSAADVLVLNKIDLVTPAALSATREWLEDRAPGALVYETRDAAFPLELVSGIGPVQRSRLAGRAKRPGAAVVATEPADPSSIFRTVTFETTRTFRAERLRTLLADMPGGVIRAKGIVRTDEAPDRSSILHFAGRSRVLKPLGAWTEDASRIVVIALDGAALAKMKERLGRAVVGVAEGAGPSEWRELALPDSRCRD